MEDENVTGSLAPEEKSYFESRGETPIKETPAVDDKPETTEPEVADVEADVEIEAEPGADDAPAAPKTVPLAALTKTRQEAKETKAKLAEMEKQNAVLADRWNMVLAAQQEHQKPAPVEEEIPDPELNPAGAIAWAVKQVQQANDAKKAEAAKTAEQRAADNEWRQTYEAVNTQYTAQVAEDPTIDAARDYMVNSIGDEAIAMGMTKAQAQQEINRIEAEHIRFAHQRNIPIGNYVKALAKARGWDGKGKEPDPVAADPAAEIDKLAEAVDGSTSLASAGGGAPKVMDAKAIADMKPEEFEKWLAKNPEKFRKLAGG